MLEDRICGMAGVGWGAMSDRGPFEMAVCQPRGRITATPRWRAEASRKAEGVGMG